MSGVPEPGHTGGCGARWHGTDDICLCALCPPLLQDCRALTRRSGSAQRGPKPLRRAKAVALSTRQPRQSWLPRWTAWTRCRQGTAWLRLPWLRLRATSEAATLGTENVTCERRPSSTGRGDHGRIMAKLSSQSAREGGSYATSSAGPEMAARQTSEMARRFRTAVVSMARPLGC